MYLCALVLISFRFCCVSVSFVDMKSAQSQNDEALTSLLYLLKANSRASDPEVSSILF